MNLNILLEEIFGNTAIVYHRGNKNKLDYLLKGTYQNKSHIDFNNYNKGLYTTFDLNSQLNMDKHQRNDMKETYGDFIIKLAVKGISNFFFCDYNLYKKYNPSCTLENWKEQQFDKFNIDKNLRKNFGSSSKYFDHTTVSKLFEKYRLLGTRVKGIVYHGRYDGNCVLIYNWNTAVPLAISNDEGKTWKKIDKNDTIELRAGFNKNDYIDTNKKITSASNIFQADENGNIDCKNSGLVTLQGAPQEVSKVFNCSYNNLTSLQGAPQKVGRNFWCFYNKLTSLQGAPQEVGGDFDCSNNKLASLQGAPQKVGGNFWCTGNKLTSLQSAPQKVGGYFVCSDNKLTSLQGAPQEVSKVFNCSYNKLASLQGAPQKVGGNFWCDENPNLTSLQGAPQEVDILYCHKTQISRAEAIRYMKSSNCKKIVGDFKAITRKSLEDKNPVN